MPYRLAWAEHSFTYSHQGIDVAPSGLFGSFRPMRVFDCAIGLELMSFVLQTWTWT
jgi:hypothetical protein